jgi:hypothetical protein
LRSSRTTSDAVNNPFVYSRPVSREGMVDREQEAERLLSLARAGHNSRVSAPRRYGKSRDYRSTASSAA